MGNLTLFMHVSLDGFGSGINGQMDWIHVDDEIFDYGAEEYMQPILPYTEEKHISLWKAIGQRRQINRTQQNMISNIQNGTNT